MHKHRCAPYSGGCEIKSAGVLKGNQDKWENSIVGTLRDPPPRKYGEWQWEDHTNRLMEKMKGFFRSDGACLWIESKYHSMRVIILS